MKTKLIVALSFIAIGLIAISIIAVIVAIEVFVLTLLGFEYDGWRNLALFLVLHGIIEYVLVIGVRVLVKSRSKRHPNIHLFFGHLFVSFIVIMTITQWMDSVYINEYGAAMFAVITALLYMLVDRFEKEEVETDSK